MESTHYIKLDEILNRIKTALENKTPFSLTRLGHGEMHVISHNIWPDHKINLYFDHYHRYAGITDLSDTIARRLINSLKKADIVGLGNHTPYNQQLLDKILDYYNLYLPYLCNAWICVEMIDSMEFFNLLRNYKILIIGRRGIEGAKYFQELGIEVTGVLGLEGFEEMDNILCLLRARTDFDIVIAAAGVPATILCPEIAEQTGKIALDFGHALDIMIDGEQFDHEQMVKDFNKMHKELRKESRRSGQ